jgi:type II secretory pathway pseudopilin PulG
MIVVVIVGILAAMAIPRFMAAGLRARQAEAKEILKQVYSMQRAYRQEYDVYFGNAITANVGAPQAYTRIGVEIMPSALYTYTMVAALNTFTCTATCGVLDDDPAVDSWTINEQGDLVPLSDDSIL